MKKNNKPKFKKGDILTIVSKEWLRNNCFTLMGDFYYKYNESKECFPEEVIEYHDFKVVINKIETWNDSHITYVTDISCMVLPEWAFKEAHMNKTQLKKEQSKNKVLDKVYRNIIRDILENKYHVHIRIIRDYTKEAIFNIGSWLQKVDLSNITVTQFQNLVKFIKLLPEKERHRFLIYFWNNPKYLIIEEDNPNIKFPHKYSKAFVVAFRSELTDMYLTDDIYSIIGKIKVVVKGFLRELIRKIKIKYTRTKLSKKERAELKVKAEAEIQKIKKSRENKNNKK